MTDKLLIKRELLRTVLDPVCSEDWYPACKQLRAILAAPRQPEGEGLPVVAYRVAHGFNLSDLWHKKDDADRDSIEVRGTVEPLCRLSDAQCTIAELREECERLHDVVALKEQDTKEAQQAASSWKAERDTLRQQLAEAKDDTSRWHEIACKQSKRADGLAGQRDKLESMLNALIRTRAPFLKPPSDPDYRRFGLICDPRITDAELLSEIAALDEANKP